MTDRNGASHPLADKKALLQVDSLSVNYGPFRALENVSIRVPEGWIVTIVGANGAGKSTLLRTISGLVAPRSGRIVFASEDITRWPAHERARRGVAQVPEGRRLFGDMTVLDNLLTGSLHGEARARREETLEEVFSLFPRLKERRHQIARTLSGGEQQMVAIGRALMSRPTLLMLDEPSLGLAPLVVKEVFQVVARLRERGLTVLLVEQNVRQSLLISDYAFVLEIGRLTHEGTGRELLHNDDVVRAYVGAPGRRR